ncbi:helix-turn-helix domain-containing protein [Streptomyces sp. NPDC057854]|uniref:helix-turn-helix domain-containing protein n=1 Tax=unclassified Streptomyces TaxID=2593676 RepID=UPI00369B2228
MPSPAPSRHEAGPLPPPRPARRPPAALPADDPQARPSVGAPGDPQARPSVRYAGDPGAPPYVRTGVVDGDDLAGARTLPVRRAGEPEAREIVVCAPLRGCLVLAPGHGGPVTPGHLLLADSAAPVTVSATAGCAVAVLRVPRGLVPFPDDALARTTGRAYDATTGVASLLHPLLLALATAGEPRGTEGTEAGRGGTATRLRNQAADLAVSLVAEEAERSTRPAADRLPEADRRAADEIRRWVNARLPDPRLRADVIAAAHHMSVRRLHKLFTGEDGTLGRWIQQRRLEECRRELGRAGGPAKVQAVAQRWGFATAAHFSRCFRARYGMAPSEWRDRRAEHGTVSVPPGRVVGQGPGDPGPGGDPQLGEDLVQMRRDGTG